MVDRISRISGSEASTRTETGHTLNLGSDAQNAWVAARQSKINDDIEERHRIAVEERAENGLPEDDEASPEHKFESRQWVEPSEREDAAEAPAEERASPAKASALAPRILTRTRPSATANSSSDAGQYPASLGEDDGDLAGRCTGAA